MKHKKTEPQAKAAHPPFIGASLNVVTFANGNTATCFGPDRHAVAKRIATLEASRAELLAIARDFLPEFDEWAGPEEKETSSSAAARNRNVRIYERFRTAVAKADGS